MPHRTSCLSHKKPSRSMPQETDLSGSEDNDLEFDSDDELPVHRNWKSSHVTNSRQRTRGRRVIDFGSDEEVGLSSGADDLVDEDFGSKQKGYKQGSNRGNFGRGRSTNTKDEFFSGSESGYKDRRYPRERLRGSKVGPGRRGNNPQGIDDFDFSADSRHGFNGTMRNKRKPFNDNFNRSSRAAQRDDYDAYRVKGRKTGLQNFRGMKREGLDNHRRGKPKNSYNWADMGGDYEDERFRRPRINVR